MRERSLWSWHLLAGLVILPLLALHMGVMHLDEIVRIFNPVKGEPIAWANVVARGKMIFFTITYILLLGTALYHGLYGLRTILFELRPADWLKRTISTVLLVGGAALFLVGFWAAVAAHGVAQAAAIGG